MRHAGCETGVVSAVNLHDLRSCVNQARAVRAVRHATIWCGALVLGILWPIGTPATEFRGRVVDAATGASIPARVYVQNDQGEWLFVTSAVPEGSALAYQEQWVPMPDSVERHTTVSAHPFHIDLPPGRYTITIERGKEYLPLETTLEIDTAPREQTFPLVRWINLAARGWYSGETHVHRRIQELPNVMAAEDLNVAFPVTFWTTRADTVPGLDPSPLRRQGPSPFGPREDLGAEPIKIDNARIIYPRNTEYEIFTVNGQPHTLGAMFVLNHRSVFRHTAPPVAGIAAQAHAEGALLDLDKHSWPWSLMLVPVAQVDLFELANNSVWRTTFGFRQVGMPLPPWVELEMEGDQALTEWGWLNFGWEIYYALLNCGFRLMPTAGTASGVHPVPLGYSRVYVHTGPTFDGNTWLDGLRRGRSFVTTGPMLLATVNAQLPGATISANDSQPVSLTVDIESVSEKPISAIEILVNGRVVDAATPACEQTRESAWQVRLRRTVVVDGSAWLVVRSIENQPDGRKRFAHTAPWHVVAPGKPLRPRRDQVEYFVGLMETEIVRNRPVLKPEALAEFQQALETYRRLARGDNNVPVQEPSFNPPPQARQEPSFNPPPQARQGPSFNPPPQARRSTESRLTRWTCLNVALPAAAG
jgi:hypothetical protein